MKVLDTFPREIREVDNLWIPLPDGQRMAARVFLPTDAEGLVEFYALVGQQSKYYRFFAPMPTLSDRDVERFTNVDHRQRVAFVITLAQKILAVGRYDVIDAERAEVAFT